MIAFHEMILSGKRWMIITLPAFVLCCVWLLIGSCQEDTAKAEHAAAETAEAEAVLGLEPRAAAEGSEPAAAEGE
jgi:hypothetical protein